ncbi:putative terminase small subunit [Escherichia coli DEC5B]|nr:putative terminase small subunit [Escherichia coli DEC5B]
MCLMAIAKTYYEEKLLIARWELTAEQAVTQQLKNEVSKGKLIDNRVLYFCPQ